MLYYISQIWKVSILFMIFKAILHKKVCICFSYMYTLYCQVA